MANERNWVSYGPAPLTSNGDANGSVKVLNTFGLYVKQRVALKSNTQQKDLEVKAVLSVTELLVGPIGSGLDKYENISMFLTSDAAVIVAASQPMSRPAPQDIIQAVYAREPIVALRNSLVDKYGRYIDTDVDSSGKTRLLASVDIDNVTIGSIDVNLTHRANYTPQPGDPDSVQIGDGTNTAKISSDGDVQTLMMNNLVPKRFDQVQITTKNANGDPLTVLYKLATVTVATLTLTYDGDGDLSNVVRS